MTDIIRLSKYEYVAQSMQTPVTDRRSSPTSAPGGTRRNILFIVADDHRHDALGFLSNPWATLLSTPHLDALARRGTAFLRAYTMGGLIPAVCSPARAALLTGLNPIAADCCPDADSVNRHPVGLRSDVPTLPETFYRAGYETFIAGKWHNDLGSLRRSFSRGANVFHGGMCDHRRVPVFAFDERSYASDLHPSVQTAEGFSTEIFCEATIDFIRKRDGERPFFAWLALTSPHDPRTPPRAFRELYVPSRIKTPDNFLAAHPFDNGELECRDELLAERPLKPGTVREHLADYFGMISHQDEQIGRVLAALESEGELANTIVIYTSDHGLSLGAHGLLGKQNMYEHSIRVPLILAGPGIPAGRQQTGLCYAFDVCSTLATLADLPFPCGDSRLLSLDEDSTGAQRDSIFSIYRDVQRAVVSDRWKLIEYHVDGRRTTQFFDLHVDPQEMNNLAAEPESRSRLDDLRRVLAEWQDGVGDQWFPRVEARVG